MSASEDAREYLRTYPPGCDIYPLVVLEDCAKEIERRGEIIAGIHRWEAGAQQRPPCWLLVEGVWTINPEICDKTGAFTACEICREVAALEAQERRSI